MGIPSVSAQPLLREVVSRRSGTCRPRAAVVPCASEVPPARGRRSRRSLRRLEAFVRREWRRVSGSRHRNQSCGEWRRVSGSSGVAESPPQSKLLLRRSSGPLRSRGVGAWLGRGPTAVGPRSSASHASPTCTTPQEVSRGRRPSFPPPSPAGPARRVGPARHAPRSVSASASARIPEACCRGSRG